MRKRNLERLGREEVEAIELWLKREPVWRGRRCPFTGLMNKCVKCDEIFPSLSTKNYCPCAEFPVKYVVKVAKRIVKELKGRDKNGKNRSM